MIPSYDSLGAVTGGLSSYGAPAVYGMMAAGAGAAYAQGGLDGLVNFGAGLAGAFIGAYAASQFVPGPTGGWNIPDQYQAGTDSSQADTSMIIAGGTGAPGPSMTVLGAYRDPSTIAFYSNDPVIYQAMSNSFASGWTGIFTPDQGLLGTLSSGQIAQGSTAITVWGIDNTPTSWQASQFQVTGQTNPTTGGDLYGWVALKEAVARGLSVTRDAIRYFTPRPSFVSGN
jgi:hypothetical protein